MDINIPQLEPTENGTTVNVHVGEARSTRESAFSSWFVKGALLLGLSYAAYAYADTVPESSRAGTAKVVVDNIASKITGRLIDPSAEENPKCRIVEPFDAGDISIHPADMPMICGRTIMSSPQYESSDILGLEVYIENQIDNATLLEIGSENGQLSAADNDRILLLNSPTGMLEQLNASGVCALAIGGIIQGINGTNITDNPFNIGSDRTVNIQLYAQNDSDTVTRIYPECT